MGLVLPHLHAGVFFLFWPLGLWWKQPLGKHSDLLRGLPAFPIVLACVASIVGEFVAWATGPKLHGHVWHHVTWASSVMIAGFASMAERRGILADGMASIALCGACLTIVGTTLGHPAPTALETRCHLLAGVPLVVAVLSLGRWCVEPTAQWARTLVYFCFTVHGFMWIFMGIWLGFFFRYNVYHIDYRDGGHADLIFLPKEGWHNYTVQILTPFGPILNHTENGKWVHDMTSADDLMRAHNVMCLGALALMVLFISRWSWVMRGGRPPSDFCKVDQAEYDGPGSGKRSGSVGNNSGEQSSPPMASTMGRTTHGGVDLP